MSTPPPFNPDNPFGQTAPPGASPGASPDPGATVRLGQGTPAAAPRQIPGLDFSEASPDLYVPPPRGAAPGANAPAASLPASDVTVRLGAAVPPPLSTPPGTTPDEGRTVAYNAQMPTGTDPVVGWLVCVDGPERGRDHRLHAGRNFVGRSTDMHVSLQGDATVSREKHCIVVYDPRANAFRVAPGESASLTYLNGASVDVPVPLAPYDRIEVGKTTLLFLPLCSDRFTWDSAA